MSLSQEPALSALKQYFVCGYRDISSEPYCGMSGRHEVGGKAVRTSNGAGPHNIQLFMLAPDGTVLNVLPGYWSPQDLIPEMKLAYALDSVWENPKLTKSQKDQYFRKMQMDHIAQHPPGMVRRSRMQGFDAQYEAKTRLDTTDVIKDRGAVRAALNMNEMVPMSAFKTTDEIMHERLAGHPFEQYQYFNVAAFCDYGKQKYDKHEDSFDSHGTIIKARESSEPQLGGWGNHRW